MVAYSLQIVGIILPVMDHSLTSIILSALLYGGTFIGIVSLMPTMVGKYYPTKPAKPMGKLTLSYGVAQIAAPALAGNIAESSGSYNSTLYLATLVMVVGIILLVILYTRNKHLN